MKGASSITHSSQLRGLNGPRQSSGLGTQIAVLPTLGCAQDGAPSHNYNSGRLISFMTAA